MVTWGLLDHVYMADLVDVVAKFTICVICAMMRIRNVCKENVHVVDFCDRDGLCRFCERYLFSDTRLDQKNSR